MIIVKNLVKKYNDRFILDNLSFTLPDKGLITLFGASGSGKTTLLNAIGGIDKEISGSISINGKTITQLNEKEMREYRLNNIGYIFQNFNLFNLESAYENVKIPLDSIAILPETIKKRRVMDALSLLGVAHLRRQKVNKLSGGEKQRIAIARAIVNSPSVILCDEPSGALDEANSIKIYKILKKISHNSLVIVASHDLAVKEYADLVLNLEDGKIISSEKSECIDNSEFPPLISQRFKRKKSSLSLTFKVKHAIEKIKEKKFRSLIINSVLSMALTGIGVSLIISSSISKKIQSAFSSLTNGNQIVMNLKNENQNTISGAYSAPIDSVNKIYSCYQEDVEGIGVTYLVNFEDFFKDKNDFFLTSTAYKILIPSLSTRSINDYRWINNEYSLLTYPYVPTTLNDDEVVLGINYVDMVNICYSLQIQRNYGSLGEYIRTHDFTIVLEVENSYWQYEDEQVLTVKAVTETNKTCFYHYSHNWNETIFEKMMLLPSIDNPDSYYPWEMYKLYYFKTYDDPSKFINKAMFDESLYDYVFERTNYSYNPGLCKIGEVCKEKRVYIYFVDKSGISFDVINQVQTLNNKMNNYFYITDYGYASYASAMLNGFAKNVFVSLSKDSLDQAIDADTSLTENGDLEIELPDDVVGGNYLNSLSGGLRFSTKPKQMIEGRLPLHNGEITISKGLSDKLGGAYGKELYIAGICSESINSLGQIEKDYQTAKVVVVGISDEDNPYLYHDGIWSISFFRDNLGISMFSLIPKAVIFELDDGEDVEKICDRFNKIFKSYNFSSPSVELSKSISSTLKYANVILYSFSALAGIISVLLLATIVMLNVIENKDEIELFRYLGISKRDCDSTFIVQALVHGFVAFLLAAIETITVDIMISKLLGMTFGSALTYSISYIPLIAIFVLSIVISFITSFVMVKILNVKKRRKILKSNI